MTEIAGGLLMAVLILVVLLGSSPAALVVALLAAVASALALMLYVLPEVGERLAVGAIVVIILGLPFWSLLVYDRMRGRSRPRRRL